LSAIPSTEPNATPQSDSNSNTNINTATPNAEPRSSQGPATAPSPAVEVSAAPLPATSSTNSSSNTAPSNPRPSAVESLLADRRRKLEMDKKEKDAVENAERKAKADARKAAVTSDPNSTKGKQATYAQQQRQRNHEAKLEKERIMRQIEQDKVERREKIEREKALVREEARVKAEGIEADEDPKDGVGGLVDKQLRFESSSNPARSRYCAVQVRLFDGSTVRNKFPSDLILRTTVRTWIEEQRSDGDAPYTLKHILTPLPNKTLSISDEEQSLQDLGFDPSATLVMVPVQGYTAAYAGNPGLVSRGASVGYSVVSSGAGMIAGALGTFLGLGQATPQTGVEETPTQQENIQPGTESRSSASSSGINVRTLHDQRDDPHDHQLYNGNQVSKQLTHRRTKADHNSSTLSHAGMILMTGTE